ncbi:MAG: DUF6438 domain-containing protein [Lysobacterales bacterium]
MKIRKVVAFFLMLSAVGFVQANNAAGQAYFEQAMALYSGDGGVEENPNAYELFKKAARAGHAEAQYFTGRLILTTHSIDDSEAVEWFRKSAVQGSAKGQYGMGFVYYWGQGVEADDERAADWFEKSASQEHPGAQTRMAEIYREGLGRPKDPKKAFELLERAAKQDNVEAQFWLATDFLKGNHLEKDASKAAFWFEAAAIQGYGPAQNWLGGLYEEGIGVQQDSLIALSWYKKSLKSWRFSNANQAIARMFEVGRGIPEDLVKAYFWFSIKPGSSAEIERLTEKMTPQQLAEANEQVKAWKLSQPEYQYRHCDVGPDGEATSFPENYPVAAVLIRLHKDGCYGPCPKYLVEIHGDGTIVLDNYGKGVGVKAANFVEPKAFEKLLSRFHEVDFFARKSAYTEIATISTIEFGIVRSGWTSIDHGANTTIRLAIGSCSKEIKLHYGIPEKLEELVQHIEKTAAVERIPM